MKDSMGAFFGLVLFSVGALAICMGVWGILGSNAIVGAFLLFGGGVAALSGARFASMPADPKMKVPMVGNYLFGMCFVVSILILLLGLAGIFSNTLASFYFVLTAFAGAAISAWSVVRASRPG